ncbi:hypothetical protein TNCV_4007511 [Trichonephila clavipes]|nr:hypothetical protein TNCV_4007511 [Trichonephila clavipes]
MEEHFISSSSAKKCNTFQDKSTEDGTKVTTHPSRMHIQKPAPMQSITSSFLHGLFVGGPFAPTPFSWNKGT